MFKETLPLVLLLVLTMLPVMEGQTTPVPAGLYASLVYDPIEDSGVFTLNITLASRPESIVELTLDNPFDQSVGLSLVSTSSEPGGSVVVDYSADAITLLLNNTSWVALYFTVENFTEPIGVGSYAAYIDLTGYTVFQNVEFTLQLPYGYTVNVTPSTGVSVAVVNGNESIMVRLTAPYLYAIVAGFTVSGAETPTATLTTGAPGTTTQGTVQSPTTTPRPVEAVNASGTLLITVAAVGLFVVVALLAVILRSRRTR
ncbi:hypothetical protein [Desulfurococcus mucosus]|uniref:Uncharacterized protein n=1 Tax=Desulfurococcus mucosus (strain ATCC 35584 / DSM 2162 / JCM 9187 / O7/1) TaxID=765177 RepID=E8R9V7_DESM0|nr:hypothetical protein [Desulfurococcus mucosus]ADV65283.1 hypothetical protein Desmu_0980 [Desulfurococcus mucosus DSM 2162]